MKIGFIGLGVTTLDPGFRSRLHRRDFGLAVDMARTLDLFLPGAASNRRLMNAAIGMGLQ